MRVMGQNHELYIIWIDYKYRMKFLFKGWFCNLGWKQFSAESGFNIENLKKLEIPETLGIFPFFCQMPNANITNTTSVGFAYCKQWWEVSFATNQNYFYSSCIWLSFWKLKGISQVLIFHPGGNYNIFNFQYIIYLCLPYYYLPYYLYLL